MITYTVIRSMRKTIQIAIQPDHTVVVRAPLLMPKITIERFVAKHQKWIATHLKNHTIPQGTGKYATYNDRDTIAYLGKRYTIVVQDCQTTQKRNTCTLTDTQLVIKKGELNTPLTQTIYAWQKAQAKKVFPAILDTCYHTFIMPYPNKPKPKLYLKRMSSRWGSLSHAKSSEPHMSLNILLIEHDVSAIRQVVFHELSHLIEQNHSKAFYAVLSQFVPNYKEIHQQLNKNLTNE